MNRRGTLILFLAGASAGTPLAHGDSITLKSSARLAPHATTITLADIATLSGTEAERFAGLEIAAIDERTQMREIALPEIRAKLEDAGAHWGKLNLNGAAVIVRPDRGLEGTSPLAMVPINLAATPAQAAVEPPEPEQAIAADLIAQPTLRGAIANVIVNHLREQPGDLRLKFREADDDVLATPTGSARFEIQPQGNPRSDRIDVAVRVWQGQRITDARTITVLPTLRRSCARLLIEVAKGATIAPGHVEPLDAWVEPSQAPASVSVDASMGRVTARGLKAGEILREHHLRRETLVRRGDLVTVRCLVGGVAVSLQAEARTEGAQGELIELRKTGERNAFMATVVARGEAIIDLSRRN